MAQFKHLKRKPNLIGLPFIYMRAAWFDNNLIIVSSIVKNSLACHLLRHYCLNISSRRLMRQNLELIVIFCVWICDIICCMWMSGSSKLSYCVNCPNLSCVMTFLTSDKNFDGSQCHLPSQMSRFNQGHLNATSNLRQHFLSTDFFP